MDGGSNGMAQDDIWDDSALVSSWNEALAEYQKYHSIHATGARLDATSTTDHAKPETSHSHVGEQPAPRPFGDADDDDEEGAAHEVERGNHHETADARAGARAPRPDGAAQQQAQDRIDDENSVANGHAPEESQASGGTAGGPSLMPPPQVLLGSVQDEGLKRLLMSWYYAGYYTGLHEGKQKPNGK